MGDVAALPFLEGTNGVCPEGIIVMDLIQRIFVPGFQLLWILAVQTQCLRNDLGGYKSTESNI